MAEELRVFDITLDDYRPVTQQDVDHYAALLKAWGRLRRGKPMEAVNTELRQAVDEINARYG